MPVGNIGYRLIMSATPDLLETTGLGQYRIRLIVCLVIKSRQMARFYFMRIVRIPSIKYSNNVLTLFNAAIRHLVSDGYQLSVR